MDDFMDEKESIQLLRKYATSDEAFDKVLAHSKAVQKLALEIAERIKKNNVAVDVDFVRVASLLHDIGRFIHPPGQDSIKHGVAGADILRKEGLDDRYVHVCERHLGAGISKEEVVSQGLPLPPKDYLPTTVEERIIAYADNITWSEKKIHSEQAVKRFAEELGAAVGERVKKLHEEIERLMGK
jgi:uncharacterized protein (TIGR00295 family)